jgi:Cu-Zn family superoxide dismutase
MTMARAFVFSQVWDHASAAPAGGAVTLDAPAYRAQRKLSRGEQIMKAMKSFFMACGLAAVLALPAVGCGGAKGGSVETGGAGNTGGTGGTTPQARVATAVIEAKSGSTLSGTATFTANGDKVTVDIEVKGAPPGEHAVHIHEHPDCSAHDAESAGGHWNPTNKAHGKWGVEPFHLGDIGNMMVAPDGTGRMSLTTDLWTVGTGEMNDVAGHSVMIHEKEDDFVTQPSGNAGGRIGCGAIQRK